ncbi:MAG TPA: diacylglycerol kinase family protein [Dehalococcoidia bacterium]|nr:diacylglycerol kinase family protein [Dehalococcoidia bacterium]
MTTCLIIRNPASRLSIPTSRLEAVLAHARAAGWETGHVSTDRHGHATEIARDAAAQGADVIVVHGGDGTLNETINGIAGSNAALAVISAGTANVWAKETHMPRDPVEAMDCIVRGERRRIDLGRAGERYFLLMAGVGLDAAIVPRVSSRMKRRLGVTAYIIAGVLTALRTKPWRVAMRIDGEPRECWLYWMLASNTRSYGGLTDIMYRARADDGLLDVGLMHRGGPLHLVADGARLIVHRHDRSPNVEFVKARTVEVETPGLPVQIDGELAGRTPMRFEVVPRALTVIVPAGFTSPLLGGVPSGAAAI